MALKNNEIIGIGRSYWTRFQKRAQIICSAFIHDESVAYPKFISYIGEKTSQSGITEAHWLSHKWHRPFLNEMKIYLGKSDNKSIEMLRKPTE